MKVEGSLGCNDRKMVEFRVLRTKRNTTVLDLRTTDLGISKDLLSRVPLDKALKGRGAQET